MANTSDLLKGSAKGQVTGALSKYTGVPGVAINALTNAFSGDMGKVGPSLMAGLMSVPFGPLGGLIGGQLMSKIFGPGKKRYVQPNDPNAVKEWANTEFMGIAPSEESRQYDWNRGNMLPANPYRSFDSPDEFAAWQASKNPPPTNPMAQGAGDIGQITPKRMGNQVMPAQRQGAGDIGQITPKRMGNQVMSAQRQGGSDMARLPEPRRSDSSNLSSLLEGGQNSGQSGGWEDTASSLANIWQIYNAQKDIQKPRAFDVGAARQPWIDQISRLDKAWGENPYAPYNDKLEAERQRVLGQKLGYSPEWSANLRTNAIEDSTKTMDEASRRLNASMAARGVKGGAYNNALQLATTEGMNQRNRALRDIDIAAAQAELGDKQAQNATIGNLMGMFGNVASGTAGYNNSLNSMYGQAASGLSAIPMQQYSADMDLYKTQSQNLSDLMSAFGASQAKGPTFNVTGGNATAQGGQGGQGGAISDSLKNWGTMSEPTFEGAYKTSTGKATDASLSVLTAAGLPPQMAQLLSPLLKQGFNSALNSGKPNGAGDTSSNPVSTLLNAPSKIQEKVNSLVDQYGNYMALDNLLDQAPEYLDSFFQPADSLLETNFFDPVEGTFDNIYNEFAQDPYWMIGL